MNWYPRDIYKKKMHVLRSRFQIFVCVILSSRSAISLASSSLPLPMRSEKQDVSSLIAEAAETSGTALQQLLRREILSGNVPDHNRQLKTVCWDAVTSDANSTLRSVRVCIRVTPDYLAIGSDQHNLRVALMPHFAQDIADTTDCLLPTTLMVDRIYTASEMKLAPRPFSPKVYEISNLSTWILNSSAIDEQLSESTGYTAEQLISGIKKDVVITNRLCEPARSPRVAIYGWHRLDGSPIQPLTLVHGASYVDYSHGIRLVSKHMTLDGVTTLTESVLQDPVFSFMLSYEGALTSATMRYHLPEPGSSK